MNNLKLITLIRERMISTLRPTHQLTYTIQNHARLLQRRVIGQNLLCVKTCLDLNCADYGQTPVDGHDCQKKEEEEAIAN